MKFRKYTHKDHNETLILFIEAFAKYPVYTAARSFFQTKADYMRFVRFIIDTFLRVQQKYNTILLAEEDGKIISAAILASPHDESPKKYDFFLSAGLSTYLPTSIGNILGFRDMIISCEDYLYTLEKDEHWQLYMFAVKKEYQGKGAGTYFMNKCVIPYVKAHSGKYLSLTTNTKKNVDFYRDCGFDVLLRDDIYYNNQVINNWCIGKDL